MRTTLKIPPGLFADDTSYASAGRWADASNVRFAEGLPETIGGWEKLHLAALSGVCRKVFPWTDNAARLNIAFGTHSALQVWQGGALYDLTPTLARPPSVLANPFTVADGSAMVTAKHAGHGLEAGDAIAVTNAGVVGRLNPNGAFAVTVVDANSYTYVAGSPADLAKTLGNNPLTVVNGSSVVTVSDLAHGITDGTMITVSGASAVGGITPNGTFAMTVIDANSYTYTFTSNATSGATGGGASVVITVPATGGVQATIAPQAAFQAGQVDGTGSAGYGTGAYGVGGYGQPSSTDYFPRTWSLAAWGENLLACPRGGTIYAWENDTSTRAAPLANAPATVTYMLAGAQDQVFALGCNEEASGTFNHLCIRHSSVRNNTEWVTGANTTAREYILPGGGRIVAGRVLGPNLLVWTSDALFLGTFVGSLAQPWRFDVVGRNCGLAGPNAAVVVGQRAFWVSPELTFRTYALGGVVEPLPCPISKDFTEHMSASQLDKIVVSGNSKFDEIRIDYPDDRDGFENSRYLALAVGGPDAGAWHRGEMARTAMVDAGPSPYPIGVTRDGRIYWHERGQSADGSVLPWFIESSDQQIDEDRAMLVRAFWPDFRAQVGPVTLTLTSRFKPMSVETAKDYQVAPTAEKVDVRASGRFFKVRFSGNSSPSFARLGAPVFDVTILGER